MSPRRNWDSPNPSTACECALPPPGSKGGGAQRLRPRGWRSSYSFDWMHSAYSVHLKGHGNEQDFFLHKSVRHGSLTCTLPFEPFQFWLRIRGDIRIWQTTPRYQRCGESFSPLSICLEAFTMLACWKLSVCLPYASFEYGGLLRTLNTVACCELSICWPFMSFWYVCLLWAFNMLACYELLIRLSVMSFQYVGLLWAFDSLVCHELSNCLPIMSFWYVCLLWAFKLFVYYELLIRLSVMSFQMYSRWKHSEAISKYMLFQGNLNFKKKHILFFNKQVFTTFSLFWVLLKYWYHVWKERHSLYYYNCKQYSCKHISLSHPWKNYLKYTQHSGTLRPEYNV